MGSLTIDKKEILNSTRFFSNKDAYKFLTVEKYFANYKEWETLSDVKSSSFNKDSNTLTIDFERSNNIKCSMLLQFIHKDILRVRFNPSKIANDYDSNNTRTIIQDSTDSLIRILYEKENFNINVNDQANFIEIITQVQDISTQISKNIMKVIVNKSQFSIQVFNYTNNSSNEEFLVWETASTPIYFTPNGDDDYAIIQSINKPQAAQYIGFGEHGGKTLSQNNCQLNYFNFDNMRYRQVYNNGPLDTREPLYHSDPFFFEFNGVKDHDSVNAIFVDNAGQLLMDIGKLDPNTYMFGNRFGDMDYYLFLGHSPLDIIESFTSIVGRSRLKPRYCLGYHQGCYGYDSRGAVEWAVNKYREYKIPLDGMHIDVDMQYKYQTFTINESNFHNPKEMFDNLDKLGIKCSTNITPVISCEDNNYSTYTEASKNNYFVRDNRFDPNNEESKQYQLYGGGNEYSPNEQIKEDQKKDYYVEGFNSQQPYIGGVYYGNDSNGQELGTKGHYADLAIREVRDWWGTQYQYLFEMGLKMVWQDMTTPAIRDYRGDMKGFPFKLYVSDNFISDSDVKKTPAIKVWNLYSYNLHKATYHGLNNLKGIDEAKRKRNFIIGRGSYTGSHRFAGLWTGDNSSDWDFLRMNIAQVLSLGMCGVIINGQDIGGFEASLDGGKWVSPELLIRWTAAGAFLPWFRNHYVRKGRKEFQEPFMFVEWFNQYRGGVIPEPQDLYRNVLPICKHYIELRYRLLQLFYDGMFANTLNGIPICRPLFLNDPHDLSLYNENQNFTNNEFFVGKDLLIAPIVDPQIENDNNTHGKRDVYLPSQSNWYCFMNNVMPLQSAIQGGTIVYGFDANLNLNKEYDPHINFIVPIYVREGAIIPTIELEQYVGELNRKNTPNPVTLNIYPGNNGTYTMYQDDGESRASASTTAHPVSLGGDIEAKDEYRQLNICHNYDKNNKKIRQIELTCEHNGYSPIFEKYMFLAILHDPSEPILSNGCLQHVTISINDGSQSELTYINSGSVEKSSEDLNNSTIDAWYYNKNINISFIKINDYFLNKSTSKITISALYN